jgi:flagellar motor component MotA
VIGIGIFIVYLVWSPIDNEMRKERQIEMEQTEFLLLLVVLVYIASVLREIRRELKKAGERGERFASSLTKIEAQLTPLPVRPYKGSNRLTVIP